MICSAVRSYMRISDQSRTDFDRAKIKLTSHFDRVDLSAVILSPENTKICGTTDIAEGQIEYINFG